MYQSYDRSVKLNAGMEAEEEVFESKFILFVCEPLRANKNKINFDEKTDDDAGMKAFYIFHEGVFFSCFNFYYSFLSRISV